MDSSLSPLLPFFEAERAAGAALALAVVVRTGGSTYRKAGALMLIAADGRYAGLLSGGCLESDLAEHARRVIATGAPHTVRYDLRSPDDLLWGLGVGCEGAMDILLLRVGPQNDWQPLAHLAGSLARHERTAVGFVPDRTAIELAPGTVVVPSAGPRAAVWEAIGSEGTRRPAPESIAQFLSHVRLECEPQWMGGTSGESLFALPLALPPRLLVLGAGPDTLPLVEFAARLGWKTTLVDHRPAYAIAARFPAAERVLCTRPEELLSVLQPDDFAAAVVMSHHLPSDLAYLRALASSRIAYVGLLGPAARREKLLADLGEAAGALRERLRAPVGLALGGRTPESIALAIVAEVHAFLHGQRGGPFRGAAAGGAETAA